MTLADLERRREEALTEARRHHEAYLKAQGAILTLDVLIADERATAATEG